MEELKQNKMGTKAVAPLLTGMAIPIVISMLVQALYNIVDSVFVAMLSEDALAAVSLAFPVQNLMIAVAVGTGIGINSLVSRRLGEKNYDAANRAANNGIFVTLLSWLLFVALGILFSKTYFDIVAPLRVDATGAELRRILDIRAMGTSYLQVVTIFSLGIFMSITMERLLQSTGRTVYSMVAQLVGALTNIILDPIMIFGLFGFPQLGVAGAAIATVVGQVLGMLVGFYFNHFKNHEIKLRLRGFRPHPKTIKQIYQVGLPSIIMQSIGSVMVFGLNSILTAFGTTAVAVLGIYFKLQSFIFMPVFGFNSALIPIVAYNYGAGKRRRIEQAIRLNLIICFCIMLAGTVLFWAIPKQLLALFNASPNLVQTGVQALRIISLCFPSAAIGIGFSGAFQALGKGIYSLIMSVVRQLVFLLPLAWLLANWSGLHAIWYAFLLAEVVSLVLSVVFFVATWKNKIRSLVEAGSK